MYVHCKCMFSNMIYSCFPPTCDGDNELGCATLESYLTCTFIQLYNICVCMDICMVLLQTIKEKNMFDKKNIGLGMLDLGSLD